jgi:hypothetical protein
MKRTYPGSSRPLEIVNLLLLVALLIGSSVPAAAKDFEFVVLGDTAYTEASYGVYEKLIEKINKTKSVFTIHVGDTLGYQLCTDQMFDRIDGFFHQFEKPLIYTPGDNEWADCYEKDPENTPDYGWTDFANYKLGRLTELRSRYFSTENSLGQEKITLTRQSENEEYKTYAENTYWIYGDVLFATAHIVGSTDSFHPHILELIHESVSRRHANYAWITELAEVAEKNKVKAIVLAAHADMFENEKAFTNDDSFSGSKIKGGSSGPYVGYVYALSELTRKFARPVLLVHGDGHRFVIDRPLIISGSEDEPEKLRYQNLLRLQVFGAPELKAVKISVDTSTESVFGFSAIY